MKTVKCLYLALILALFSSCSSLKMPQYTQLNKVRVDREQNSFASSENELSESGFEEMASIQSRLINNDYCIDSLHPKHESPYCSFREMIPVLNQEIVEVSLNSISCKLFSHAKSGIKENRNTDLVWLILLTVIIIAMIAVLFNAIMEASLLTLLALIFVFPLVLILALILGLAILSNAPVNANNTSANDDKYKKWGRKSRHANSTNTFSNKKQ
ncbi:MAG: hypothetical protein JXR53_13870 [Bacteroidales bacterium]|nr:hypothetical protein [Bacteroidales bacterium]